MAEKKQPDNPDEDRLELEDLAPKGDELKGGRRLRDDDDCSSKGPDCSKCSCDDSLSKRGSKGGPSGTLRK